MVDLPPPHPPQNHLHINFCRPESWRGPSISALELLSKSLSRWLNFTLAWTETASERWQIWCIGDSRVLGQQKLEFVVFLIGLSHVSASTYGSKVLFRLTGTRSRQKADSIFLLSFLTFTQPCPSLAPSCNGTLGCSAVLTSFLFFFYK